jgi:hypothetical protein
MKRLYKLGLGESITIFHKPFTYVGHTQIELDSGHRQRWLYDDEGRVLCVSPQDEELILFREIQEELEPEEELIKYQDKEYQFEYEDAGNVLESEGETVAEEDDRFLFSDYQTESGEIIRLIENETTGESSAYIGTYASDEDVAEL